MSAQLGNKWRSEREIKASNRNVCILEPWHWIISHENFGLISSFKLENINYKDEL